MIKINNQQLNKVIDYLNNSYTLSEFDFYSASPGKIFPAKNLNWVLDFFFIVTLQQFGFWELKNNKYSNPMYCSIDNLELKGSDYLWYKTNRIFINNPDTLSRENLKNLTENDFKKLYSDDTGKCNLPMLKERVQLWNNYAKDMEMLELTPELLVKKANKSKLTVPYLIKYLKQISGYKEDPLLKKAYLLAMTLLVRPEKFLKGNQNHLKPIIDYHIQRSLLRMGIVEIDAKYLEEKIKIRKLISSEEEEQIRNICYKCINIILNKTNKTASEIDYFFFLNRINCPEMKTPDCDECIYEDICLKRKELFQPILRTTYY
jgi:hypothetical protein